MGLSGTRPDSPTEDVLPKVSILPNQTPLPGVQLFFRFRDGTQFHYQGSILNPLGDGSLDSLGVPRGGNDRRDLMYP